MEYSFDTAFALLASPFVEDSLFAASLGGGKQEPDSVRRYLELPLAARPDVAPYFDRAWYLLRYPDIGAGEIDPLLHFIGWGAAEGRAPHPLIDLGFMRESAPELVSETLSAEALLDLLDRDRLDPSRWFSRAFYSSQLDDPRAVRGGLLRHFLSEGLLAGLKPAPGLDPIAAYRQARGRSLDLREGLRRLALPGASARLPEPEPPPEDQAKALFLTQARALTLAYARTPLDFGVGETTPPVLSVVMVAHDRFELTMGALASLRANFTGPIELVLVDSGSRDETRHIGPRYVRGAQILRFADNIGFVHGCNTALRVASADAVLLLNNDVELTPGAIDAALARLRSDETIGAVGAKLVRAHGLLQEAGCIVWRDGWTSGYLRDAPAMAPEANFVRDVDFCSAAFLLLRGDLVRKLGGFDEEFAPAYYEDTDLCLRISQAGFRVVYDPAVVARHLEFGTSGSLRAAAERIAARRERFFRKHMARLRFRYTADARAQVFARTARPPRGRVLFIEDQVPVRRLGQGFVRSNDIVRALAGMDYHVTVYPLFPSPFDLAVIQGDMPDNVEVMHDRRLEDLESFLRARRGYYDTIWICRTHNLDRVKPVLEAGGTDFLGGVRLVLDTEAIGSLREAARRAVLGEADGFDLDEAIRAEFANAWLCQSIVAVSEAEAARLRALGFPDVAVLGHAREVTPTPRPFAERSGMLFVGALPVQDCPNMDGLLWFAEHVMPLIEAELGHEGRLTVAGYVGPDVDLSRLAANPRITLRGEVADLTPLYDRHRVVVAPTRYAAGIPYKVHEAAAMGVPVVASEVLCGQLGWEAEREILSASVAAPAEFANAVIRVSQGAPLWEGLRKNDSARALAECSVVGFENRVRAIIVAGDFQGEAVTYTGGELRLESIIRDSYQKSAMEYAWNTTPDDIKVH